MRVASMRVASMRVAASLRSPPQTTSCRGRTRYFLTNPEGR